MIEIVCATEFPKYLFPKFTALGRSITRLERLRTKFESFVFYENKEGLSKCYNERISKSAAEILIFVHDDVWLDDFHVLLRVAEGLKENDIIGVAGCRIRFPSQVSWHKPMAAGHSGAVAHSWPESHPFGMVTDFGDAPVPCELLDGVFMAAKLESLRAAEVAFDPLFTFHFYDLDFCRTARSKGLRISTWPIAITHESPGRYGPDWESAKVDYLKKWTI